MNTPKTSPPQEAGFTLFEALTVLAIIAIAIATAATAVRGNAASAQLQPLVMRVAADLRLARADALASRQPVAVTFDPTTHAYRNGDARSPTALPRSVQFQLVVGTEGRKPDQDGQIIFYPDGSASATQLTLTNQGRAFTLVVDGLTGIVTSRKGGT